MVDLSDNINTTGKQLVISEDNGHSDIEEWIDEWRAGWSGKRAKGMGDRATCINNMTKFFSTHSKYTKQDVFEARDVYFKDTLQQYGNYQYLQQADYFIKKKDKITGDVTQNLVIYCEQVVLSRTHTDTSFKPFSIYDDL